MLGGRPGLEPPSPAHQQTHGRGPSGAQLGTYQQAPQTCDCNQPLARVGPLWPGTQPRHTTMHHESQQRSNGAARPYHTPVHQRQSCSSLNIYPTFFAASRMCGVAAWMRRKGAVQCTSNMVCLHTVAIGQRAVSLRARQVTVWARLAIARARRHGCSAQASK